MGTPQVLGHKSGQHLVVRGQWDCQPVTRQYSILSRASTAGSFSLLIKVYPLGMMSCVVQDWAIGSRISARGPFGEPPDLLDKETRVVMFCQGTGLVPLLPMLQDLLEQETETTGTSEGGNRQETREERRLGGGKDWKQVPCVWQ